MKTNPSSLLRVNFFKVILYTLITLAIPNLSLATGSIAGRVIDSKSRNGIPFASIVVEGTNTGATADSAGFFRINSVQEGYQRIIATSVGYQTKISEDLFVTSEKTPYTEIALEPTATNLNEIVITGPQFVKKEESPVSMQTIGIREIERNPGGNRDISKVIRSLPGVASTPSFRNDIIIRGGSPGENKFYLDGIEIPVINHFQTQGSTGGPVGIINVDLIREVDFYSGAFPVARGNALSSVMEFRQTEGNKEKNGIRFTIGSSEAGLTADGPLSSKTNYIFSVRRSYLQFLFAALKLPFLPTFNDVQFKVTHRINEKNEISFLGLAGYDVFRLNLSATEGVTDSAVIERNNYILGNIPANEQWNYTSGIHYRHFGKNSNTSVVLSRNSLQNSSEKYINNDDTDPALKLLDYLSEESENKLRVENTLSANRYKLISGFGLETGSTTQKGFNLITGQTGPIKISYNTKASIIKYSGFASLTRQLLKNRMTLTGGLRMDGTNYSKLTSNPADQISPRLAASFAFNEKWSLNASTGRFYQLPSYTILAFGNEYGDLANKNYAKYIRCDHFVAGVRLDPNPSSKISFEVFRKNYAYYPVSVVKGISLANLGSDFGVIGNEQINSISKGRAYGAEFLAQRRSSTGLYGIVAITLVRSEFESGNDLYVASTWDNHFITTLTAGKKLGKDWEAGMKWRFVSGRPYTPYDVNASALKSNWDSSGTGVIDYNQFNSKRVPDFHQLDIRIDKTWYLKKWSLNLYLDIENLYNFKAKEPDILNVKRDAAGNLLTDPNDATRYQTYLIKNESGNTLPSIGLILDF